MKRLLHRIVLPVACLANLSIGIWVGTRLSLFVDAPTPNANGIVCDDPQIVNNFHLIDQSGGSFSAENFLGHCSLVYFGFSNCSAHCLNTLIELQSLREQLADGDEHQVDSATQV